MKLLLVSIYDEKGKAFSPPMAYGNRGLALRAMTDLVSGQSTVSKYPDDFKLYEVGMFDDESGSSENVVPPVFVVNMSELKKGS